MDKYYYCYRCDYDYIYGVIFVFRDNSLFFQFSKIVLLLTIGIALLLLLARCEERRKKWASDIFFF